VKEVERAVIAIKKRRMELLIFEILQTVLNGRSLSEMTEGFNEHPRHYDLRSGWVAMSRVALGCEPSTSEDCGQGCEKSNDMAHGVLHCAISTGAA